MNRRAIITALVEQLKTIAPFKSVSLKAYLPDQLTEQPALTVIFNGGIYPARAAKGAPSVVTIDAEIWIFDKPDDPDEQFGLTMADYIDAVDQSFAPDAFGRPQTLGGLVFDMRIEGDVILDPGHISGQGVVKVPIKILVP